jgi:hypothetical protein
MKQKPATRRARELMFKLESLAARPGTSSEGKSAAKKIARLKKRYDFDAKAPCEQRDVKDIFKGAFRAATEASQIYSFAGDYTIANSVKWAIEYSTKIKCVWRGGVLLAQAEPSTASKLHEIAATICSSFAHLWEEFSKCSGVNAADRGVFIMGLYDGMMDEVRPAMLPNRASKPSKIKRAKRKAIAPAPHVAVHPYSIAVGFGKQIRFSTPWNVIAKELEPFKPKEMEPA